MSINAKQYIKTTPLARIESWVNIINERLKKGKDIYWVGDTETTGTNYKQTGVSRAPRDRLLEIGLLAFKINDNGLLIPLTDKDNKQIYVHEYVNPFIETSNKYGSTIEDIPNDVKKIHGISLDFLECKDSLGSKGEIYLKQPAKDFQYTKQILEAILDVERNMEHIGKHYFVAHNAHFDISFLDAEFANCFDTSINKSHSRSFQSLVHTIDTLSLIKELYNKTAFKKAIETRIGLSTTKVSYNLDFLMTFYSISNNKRELHGALVDAHILSEVYNGIISDMREHRSNSDYAVIKKSNFNQIDIKKI